MESAARNGLGGASDNFNEGRMLEPTIPTDTPAPIVNAPMVIESPVVVESKYVKTAKIPDKFSNDSMYSLIVGEVLNIHIRRDCALESNYRNEKNQCCGASFEALLDPKKSRPVARLGYGQEYTVIEDYFSQN
jgi:flavin reductase (DIM6/NTAB) family NADH-FMN oxidoreductase RutF